eukprot:1695495-Pyramimonas_sp.AAC.1
MKLTGRLDEAEEMAREFLGIAIRVHGDDHVHVANGRINLADILHKKGKHKDAIGMYQSLLDMCDRLQGEGILDKFDITQKLGVVYDSMGDLEEGVACLERAVAQNPSDQEVASCLNTLAVLRMKRQEFDLALPLLERYLETREKEFGAKHPHVATACNNL